MLRSETQSALDAVIVQAQAAAERYSAAVGRLPGTELRELLTRRGTQLELMARELGTDLQTLDELPGQPDPERSLLAALMERLRESVSDNLTTTVLRERLADEIRLEELVSQALALELIPAAREHLRRHEHHCHRMRTRLEDLLARADRTQ